jgi:hypothetical protein
MIYHYLIINLWFFSCNIHVEDWECVHKHCYENTRQWGCLSNNEVFGDLVIGQTTSLSDDDYIWESACCRMRGLLLAVLELLVIGCYAIGWPRYWRFHCSWVHVLLFSRGSFSSFSRALLRISFPDGRSAKNHHLTETTQQEQTHLDDLKKNLEEKVNLDSELVIITDSRALQKYLFALIPVDSCWCTVLDSSYVYAVIIWTSNCHAFM